jgi:DnaJ-class molecular chaperone
MDYYGTLGLKRGASDAEIKKAYRSLAMKHHPDRGGDEKKFKDISVAYETLTNPEKKRIIDMGGDPNAHPGMGGGFGQNGPFEFHFNSRNFDDIFGFGFGRQPMRKNKSLSINVQITLEDVLTGKDLSAEVGIPGGKSKMINIHIPQGIDHGQQIRYEGMGDHSMPDISPGDLIVNVFIQPHQTFRREGNSLIFEKEISVWDAILGTNLEIKTLDKKTLNITIPQGTQPETMLSCRGEGLPHMRTKQRGNLLIKIKIAVPKNLTAEQKQLIENIKNAV